MPGGADGPGMEWVSGMQRPGVITRLRGIRPAPGTRWPRRRREPGCL